jgi:uncharacterized OB-fold protein
LPALDNWNRPFWEATREKRLVAQECGDCGHVFFPPGPVCPHCLSANLAWRRLSGRGTVESWVVFHQLYYKGFADDVPYNVAMIRLDEGARLFSNIVGTANADIYVDMKVEVTFEPATEELSIPKFRPVDAGGHDHV